MTVGLGPQHADELESRGDVLKRLSYKELKAIFGMPKGRCRGCGIEIPTRIRLGTKDGLKRPFIKAACAWFCVTHCPLPQGHDHFYREWS